MYGVVWKWYVLNCSYIHTITANYFVFFAFHVQSTLPKWVTKTFIFSNVCKVTKTSQTAILEIFKRKFDSSSNGIDKSWKDIRASFCEKLWQWFKQPTIFLKIMSFQFLFCFKNNDAFTNPTMFREWLWNIYFSVIFLKYIHKNLTWMICGKKNCYFASEVGEIFHYFLLNK